MTGDAPTCAEQIGTETLSAWRDSLLPAAEMERIAEHSAGCAACRGHLAAFEQVARALRRQRELEPGARIRAGVLRRVAHRGRARARRSAARRWALTGGAGALAATVALVLLFGIVLRGLGGSTTAPPAGDAAIKSQLTYAYVQGNEVWVSLRGAPPRQVTHLGVTGEYSFWNLFWADDASRLLMVASGANAAKPLAWVLTLPEGSVRLLPDKSVTPRLVPSPVASGCIADFICYWLGDRYILYVDVGPHAPNFNYYAVYDIQTDQRLTTPIDGVGITRGEVRRGSFYYTTNEPGTRLVNSLDMARHGAGPVFTTPGPLVSEGGGEPRLIGGWDLASDAHRLVSWYSTPLADQPCPAAPCTAFDENTDGAITAIFPSRQIAKASISPDGRQVAAVASRFPSANGALPPFDIVEQALPTGRVLTNALPFASDRHDLLGIQWTAQGDQLVVLRARISDDAGATAHDLIIYTAPAGSDQLLHQVTEIAPFPRQLDAGFAWAPVGMLHHGDGLAGLDL